MLHRIEAPNRRIWRGLRGRLARGGAAQPRWMDWAEAIGSETAAPAHILAAWFHHYVMAPHPDLGRLGHVCPYMAQAARLSLVRIGISDLSSDDYDAILDLVIAAQVLFDALPCPRSKRAFRAVVVAFPACADAGGIGTLQKVQYDLRFRSALGKKMVGLFEPDSMQPGIVNPAFLSFRCPIPVIAIRPLVEADAAFVLRNPLMIPSYLLTFGASGRRSLLKALRRHWETPGRHGTKINSMLIKFKQRLNHQLPR